MIYDTLKQIAIELNKNDILWGVGASVLLEFYGLIDKPKDIDIIVYEKDIEKADKVLKSLGIKKTSEENKTYSTKYFYEYVINGVEIDVISGLVINCESIKYEHEFDSSSITNYKNIDDIKIPLTSLEEWYVLYQIIPNREYKAKIIEEYLLSQSKLNIELLNRALSKELPYSVKVKIIKLINFFRK